MAAVEDRHIVLLCHFVDGIEEGEEVLLCVDVLFSVRREQDVFSLFQSKTLVNIAGFDLGQVIVEHFGHRRTCDVGTFFGQACIGEIATCMFGIGHIDVGDDIDDASICLFGEAFVLATVSSFHMEDGDVETLCSDDAEAGVGVAKHEYCIRLHFDHELIALCDDVAHRLAKVGSYGFHVYIRVSKFEVLEEDTVEVVVVVLTCVCKEAVEVLSAFVYHCSKADYLGASSDNDEKFQFPILFEFCHNMMCYNFTIRFRGTCI